VGRESTEYQILGLFLQVFLSMDCDGICGTIAGSVDPFFNALALADNV
jgi:hypothetical protein